MIVDNLLTPTGAYALLRDGGQVLIRPYAASDRPAIEEFFARLSVESRAMRFHSSGSRVSQDSIDQPSPF